MRRLALLSFLLLLSGCMTGPDYHRPEMDVPPSFRYAEADTKQTADTEWWKSFEDPVLTALIGEALTNNHTLKAAAANIEQAAAVLMQVRSPLFPQADYGAAAGRARTSGLGTGPLSSLIENPSDSFQVFAGASWEIDLWGRIRRLSEAARADLFASKEAYRGVILSLVSAVAESYIQLRGLDEQLAIARRTLEAYGESVKLFELQHRHGQVSRLIVEQARSQYQTAAAAIPQIESQIAQTENALSILLGRNPGGIDRGRSILEMALPAVPAGLPSELLERRPDLAQAEQNLIAANARIGAAKALYFPTISLTGAFGFESSELSDLFQGSSKTWSYSGSVTGPIFTAGAIKGQVKQAEAARLASLETYRNTILNAFKDTENALVSRRKLSNELGARESLTAALREYARLARMQYDGGYTPYLTVLDAESQLFPAELNVAQTRTLLLTSYITLYKSLGGGVGPR
ncbi:RND efflux system, outer membrane lipoprotein, NodT family [uncultured Desulfatiglans sp.]|nr:RND efflux system, outer membrane lipoprotein, NodT family [uncultured Desulfatiglans sp.]